MEEVLTEAHLAIEVDVGGLSSLFPYDADAANTCRSRLAFDGCALFCATQHRLLFVSRVRLGVLCEAPPPPLVRCVRWMYRPPHPLVSRNRCGCAVVTTTFIRRLRPALDGCWVPLCLSFASRVRWACAVTTTTSISFAFPFNGCLLCTSPHCLISLSMGCAVTASSSTGRLRLESPVVRISCSAGWAANILSFASRVR